MKSKGEKWEEGGRGRGWRGVDGDRKEERSGGVGRGRRGKDGEVERGGEGERSGRGKRKKERRAGSRR